MKYFLICNFATMECDRETVANILNKHHIDFVNCNNFLWELDVPESFKSPFVKNVAEQIGSLFCAYTSVDSDLLVVKADEYFDRTMIPF